jgi:hypothetical protein
MEELDSDERTFVWQQRIGQLINQWMHGVALTASQHQFLSIYGHDTVLMASHYGRVVSINNLCNAFLG